MGRVAVIGGGISGLAAAHRLIELAAAAAMPIRVALFEAGPRLGGVIQTERIGNCLVELGADSFITNKPWAIDLCRRLGLEDRLISTDPKYRQALVLRNGKPVRGAGRFPADGAGENLAGRHARPFSVRWASCEWVWSAGSRHARTRWTKAWPRLFAGGWDARRSSGSSSRWWPASTRPIPKNSVSGRRFRDSWKWNAGTAA